VQALEICHTKLVQAFVFRIRSIAYREVVIDRGQDCGVDRALESKRCSWRLYDLCKGMKLCIRDKVIASYTKPDAVSAAGLTLITLCQFHQYGMFRRFHPCPTHFHATELAVATSRCGFAVRPLLTPEIVTLLDCCGDDHRELQVMSC
jgi:hypothetical protein